MIKLAQEFNPVDILSSCPLVLRRLIPDSAFYEARVKEKVGSDQLGMWRSAASVREGSWRTWHCIPLGFGFTVPHHPQALKGVLYSDQRVASISGLAVRYCRGGRFAEWQGDTQRTAPKSDGEYPGAGKGTVGTPNNTPQQIARAPTTARKSLALGVRGRG